MTICLVILMIIAFLTDWLIKLFDSNMDFRHLLLKGQLIRCSYSIVQAILSFLPVIFSKCTATVVIIFMFMYIRILPYCTKRNHIKLLTRQYMCIQRYVLRIIKREWLLKRLGNPKHIRPKLNQPGGFKPFKPSQVQ